LLVQSIDLIGTRAKLTPLGMEHTEGIWEASKSPEIWTYLPEKIVSYEDSRTFMEEALLEKEKGMEMPFAVIDQDTGTVLGSTRFLNLSTPNRSLEIGWTCYNPSAWRTRINTECKYLLLSYCFETLHTVRVQFSADIRNERSNQAIRRLGAMHEGILRRNRILSDGYIRDANVYSIIAEEWYGVKSHLENLLV
jgi:N-acetyltransferase